MQNFKTHPIRLAVGQLQSNCYLYPIDGKHAIIIDPGEDDQYIIGKLTELELTPVAILATHGHYDHLLAAFTLQATYNIPFYIHKDDDFLLTRMRETAIHFGETDPGPAPIVTKFLDDSTKEFSALENTIMVIQTHGHTPGSVSYYDKTNKVAFVGDLLFADGSIGEVTHKYSNRTETKQSIKKILSLPEETTICSGHGEEATIGELKEKFSWALG